MRKASRALARSAAAGLNSSPGRNANPPRIIAATASPVSMLIFILVLLSVRGLSISVEIKQLKTDGSPHCLPDKRAFLSPLDVSSVQDGGEEQYWTKTVAPQFPMQDKAYPSTRREPLAKGTTLRPARFIAPLGTRCNAFSAL